MVHRLEGGCSAEEAVGGDMWGKRGKVLDRWLTLENNDGLT